jgi:hypothetical protein
MTRVEPDPTQPKQPEKSLGELFGELSHEFSELVSTQTELAKSEIREQTQKAKVVGGAFGAAALAGYMALLLLSFAAAWGLSEVMPEGVAFLVVGVVYALAAGLLFARARQRAKEMKVIPKETVESLKEDVQWARQNVG